MNIISRSQWGARSPKKTPTTVAPSRRLYYVVHYSGAPASQSVKDIQGWCMDGRGFNDIDYNFLVRGTTGEIYEGRGWDVVGSHTVGYNTNGIGVCIISNGPASDAAKLAVRWLYDQAVARAGHGLQIKGHRQLATTGTSCPGSAIFAWVQGGMLAPGSAATPRTLSLGMTGDDVKALQIKLKITADGSFGPLTKSAVIAFQAKNGLAPDGVVGPATRAKLGLG
jgi:hypothetical protein